MSLRAILLASALAGATPLAAANADGVRDVLVVDRDGTHVWIALAAMPERIDAQTGPGRVVLDLPGLSLTEARRIIPVAGGPLTRVTAMPAEAGARLVVEGDFNAAVASLRQGGIWIALDGRLDDAALMAAGESDQPGGWAAQALAGGDPDTGRDEIDARHVASPSSQDRAEPQPAPAGPRVTAAQGAVAQPSSAAAPVDAGAAAAAPDERSEAALPSAPPGDGDPSGFEEAAPEAAVEADPEAPGPCDATAAAVQQSPWDLDALTRHADCLAGLGPDARENAAGLYERVLAFEPTHFQAAIGLARIREAQGRGQEAAELFERAASMALTDGEALAARAAAQRSRDD